MEKYAVVTGAYRGLGLEFCKQLLERDYRVLLTARTMEKAQAAVDRLQHPQAHPGELDVGDEGSIIRLAQRLKSSEQKVQLLVNNAGINAKDDPNRETMLKNFTLNHLDPEQVLQSVRVNSLGPILTVKHLRPFLARAKCAYVLNVSSWLGSIGKKEIPGHYSYSGSKCALNMFTKALALEVAKNNIICVAVNPGWVQTDMGGKEAHLTVQQSVSGILSNVLDRISLEDSGKFLQWDGTEHPW